MTETMTGTVLNNGKVPGGMIRKCHVSDLNGQYLSGGNDNHGIGCGNLQYSCSLSKDGLFCYGVQPHNGASTTALG